MVYINSYIWLKKTVACYLPLLRSYIITKKRLLGHLIMYLGTVIDMNEILNVFLGDDSDAGIDLGYENHFYNEINDCDKLSQQHQ